MLMDIAPFLKIRAPWNIFAIDIADNATRADIIIADCRISETGAHDQEAFAVHHELLRAQGE